MKQLASLLLPPELTTPRQKVGAHGQNGMEQKRKTSKKMKRETWLSSVSLTATLSITIVGLICVTHKML